jgi:hypothetical protein
LTTQADEERMTPNENQTDVPETPVLARRPLRARGRGALGAGAVALALAVALPACGSDDGGSSTSTAASGATTAQTNAATTEAPADNGVADKSAEEILAAAQEAASAASAVRVAGQIDDLGLELNLVRGEGASGSLRQGTNAFEIIATGSEVFLKGSAEFYEQIGGRAAVQLLGDKWLQVPGDDEDFASMTQLTDMDQLLTQVLRPKHDALTKGEVETVDGTEAIALSSGDGTLYVATTGDPLPLKLVGDRDRRGEILFTDWNKPADLTAPTDAIDISELQR